MGCDGSGQTNLTNHSANDRDPTWAGGGKLAFSSNRSSDGGYDIYLLTIDPWQIDRLTTNSADDESPALSPDGSKIAYVSYRDGGSDPEIYVLTISDRSLVQITDNTAADVDPAWSSDGTKLAFASDRDGNYDIFEADADGSNVEKVTDVSHADHHDRWPNLGDYFGDELVAFASDRDGGWEVYSFDAYDLYRATENSDSEVDAQPSWNNSGEQMVYQSSRDTDYNVYKSDYDGSSPIDLNSYSVEGNDTSPDWEPVVDAEYCEGKPEEP